LKIAAFFKSRAGKNIEKASLQGCRTAWIAKQATAVKGRDERRIRAAIDSRHPYRLMADKAGKSKVCLPAYDKL
jgi:hypothetical protein